MYKSIKEIQKLREEKQKILRNVYQSNALDDVYRNQRELGSMAINIYTDAANAIMPVLPDDGVNKLVWPKISRRLDKLSFISVSTAAEIRENHKKSMDNPTVIKINGASPKTGTRKNVKIIPLPAFLSALVAQGIAVPLIISTIGGTKLALVKIILYASNGACMGIEVVKYFDLFSKKGKKTMAAPSKTEPAPDIDYEAMYNQAIRKAYDVNNEKLNEWFNRLEKITTEEIDKALGEMEG